MLWDKSHSDYRDRNLQNVKWTEIADLMNMSVNNVKSMWKYLKDQFRVNFHAICSKKSGQEYVEDQDINLVKWPFFRQLMFLKDVVTRRDTSSNIQFPENIKSQDDGNSDEADTLLKRIGKEIDVPFDEEIITPDQDEDELEMPENVNGEKESGHRDATPSTSKDTAWSKGPSKNQDATQSARHPTRASTVKVAKKRKRGTDEIDAIDEDIDKEINKIYRFLAASITHECEKNVSGRSGKFCQYLAELIKLVDVDIQRPCEAEILKVVDKYIELSKQRADSTFAANDE